MKSLARIIQIPIKGLKKQVPDVTRIKTDAKSPLKNNVIGAAKRTRSIRKREFDKLRTLRRHQATGEEVHLRQFFPIDMHSKMENRASTLKKIDEIEVQMSMQWWKTDRLDLDKNK